MKNLSFVSISKNASTANAVSVLISALLLVFASLQPANTSLSIILYALSLAVACYNPAVDGIEALLNKKLSPNIISTISVLLIFLSRKPSGDLVITHYQEAALIAIIYCFLLVALDYIRLALTKQYMSLCGYKLSYSKVEGDTVVDTTAEKLRIGDVIAVDSGDFLMFSGQTENGKKVFSGVYNGEPCNVKIVSLYSYAIDFDATKAKKTSSIESTVLKLSKFYPYVMLGVAIIYTVIVMMLTQQAITIVLYNTASLILLANALMLTSGVFSGYALAMASYKNSGLVLMDSSEIDNLSMVDAVIINKNKLITRGEYSVAEVYCAEGYTREQLLKICAAIQPDDNNPFARAIIEQAGEPTSKIPGEFVEGKGIIASANSKQVFCGSALLMRENGIDAPVYPDASINLSVDGELIGAIKLSDKMKNEAIKAVKLLRAYKINITVVTSDNEITTQKVSELCGTNGYVALADSAAKAKCVADSKKTHHTAYVGDDTASLSAASIAISAEPNEQYNSLTDSSLLCFAKALISAKKINNAITIKFYASLIITLLLILLSLFGIIKPWHISIVIALFGASMMYLLPKLSVDSKQSKKDK